MLHLTCVVSARGIHNLGGSMNASPHLASNASTRMNALFIDPDPEVREMLTNALDPAAWSVRHAPDNETAFDLARETHFDFILTSDKTSGKEDVDLLRRIRSVRQHTRLIILTEESTPADVIKSIDEHAFSYFTRPFSLASLAEMVHAAAEA